MAGLERPIVITIQLGGTDFKPVKAPKENPKKKEMDKLLLRLSNRDALDDSELSKLTEDVIVFARSTLEKRDASTLREFLKEAKHMLTPDMRDMLSDDLKLNKMLNERRTKDGS